MSRHSEWSRRDLRSQEGISLPMALVALMLGTLLVVPMLDHLRTRHQTESRLRQTVMAQYASEAGVQYAIHRLNANPGYRALVRSQGSSGVQEAPGLIVNDLSPTIRVAIVDRSFHYTIWGDSQTCASSFDWTGSNNLLAGDAHSNAGLKISGAEVTGVLEYATTPHINTNNVDFTLTISNPVQVSPWTVEEPLFEYSQYTDPDAEGTVAWEEAPDHFIYWPGDLEISTSAQIQPAIYHVTGNLHINGSDIVGTATFVVDGTIKVNGSGIHLTPYRDKLLLFSNYAYPASTRCSKWVVDIAGSGNDVMDGWIYAPYGLIQISGSGSLAGAFFGDSVSISGSSLEVHQPPSQEAEEDCETFDIESTAGGTTTRARVALCRNPRSTQIKSWSIAGGG